jgi:hypothetical protein
MRSALLVAASVAPLLFAAATDASAQYRYGGGFRGGGWHGGGWHGGGGGWYGRGIGVRAGYPGYRAGWGWRGGGWHGAGFYRRPYGWGGYYPYRRWGWGGYPYWGVGAGLATAAVIGAAASYPAYAYPAYPAYQVYEVDASAIGGQCSTPVRICTLYDPAPLGTGCSCRIPGGHARGVVVGP